MQIRLLRVEEIHWAVLTATEIFTLTRLEEVNSPEEIDNFRKLVNETYLREQMHSGKIYLWGAIDDNFGVEPLNQRNLCGVGAMSDDGTIQMLYIRPEYQDSSCETKLLDAMYQFRIHGYKETIDGKYKKDWVPIICVGGLVFIVVVVLMALRMHRIETMQHVESQIEMSDDLDEEDEMGVGYYGHGDELSESQLRTEVIGTMEELPNQLGVVLAAPPNEVYVAENVEYTITAEQIESFEHEGGVWSEFNVNYPQIVYNDGRDASEVNQILRDCACIWYDRMYPEPQFDLLLYGENDNYLCMITEVEYQITYMSNQLICVVFYDHYCPGTEYYIADDLRTRVIDLETGKVYGIEEVITADAKLGQLYYEKLCEADDVYEELPLLTSEVLEQTFCGEWVDARYLSNLIVTGDGIRIGFTMHYGDGNRIVRGWDAVKFSEKELESYRLDSRFWEIIDGE